MNKQWSSLLDFAVRGFIVVVLAYLLTSLFFMQDMKRITQSIDALDKKIQMYSEIFSRGNPESLYANAIREEQAGNLEKAKANAMLAVRFAEVNQQKYLGKLKELMAK